MFQQLKLDFFFFFYCSLKGRWKERECPSGRIYVAVQESQYTGNLKLISAIISLNFVSSVNLLFSSISLFRQKKPTKIPSFVLIMILYYIY